ncbi:hypothetical protein EUX98_g7417 [Antrodiella citrinella]|uniref:NADP-dependent oxidoreductase domain-containing protein n=1 Tax=Antrodiella citrinella TaxID=2447956 RepID=A0A4S4MNZ4_9APHY|nr:hypothetical protein EUX98_g7417 [Antrodiella citrinella]
MPWDVIKLNDGNVIPKIAFGTWTLGNGQQATDNVDQAIDVGFTHIDTAQSYRNEAEAGVAIHESGLAREDLFITTKYSGLNGLDVETSIQNSLQNLGVKYVDLYLVHHPRLAVPDIPTLWAKMEKIKQDGFAKSIGVSNFEIEDLQVLLASAKIKPAANQVLLAWASAKGAIVVTSSTKKERLEGYLDAGDIKLTPEDVSAIDSAGVAGARCMVVRSTLKRLVVVALVGAAVLGTCGYFGIDVL